MTTRPRLSAQYRIYELGSTGIFEIVRNSGDLHGFQSYATASTYAEALQLVSEAERLDRTFPLSR